MGNYQRLNNKYLEKLKNGIISLLSPSPEFEKNFQNPRKF